MDGDGDKIISGSSAPLKCSNILTVNVLGAFPSLTRPRSSSNQAHFIGPSKRRRCSRTTTTMDAVCAPVSGCSPYAAQLVRVAPGPTVELTTCEPAPSLQAPPNDKQQQAPPTLFQTGGGAAVDVDVASWRRVGCHPRSHPRVGFPRLCHGTWDPLRPRAGGQRDGHPVASVPQAEAVLLRRQSSKQPQQQQQPYTVLYVVDMTAYYRRSHFVGGTPKLAAAAPRILIR